MVLVFALTRATQHGWGSASTIGLSRICGSRRPHSSRSSGGPHRRSCRSRSFGVRRRRRDPDHRDRRVDRFSQFFLLTLYLQQVLHYSAARTGLAFVAIAAHRRGDLERRAAVRDVLGPRRVLAAGLLLAALAEGLLVRLPVHGHYLTDLLPSFILIGAGIGTSFVAVTIAALAGVPRGTRALRPGSSTPRVRSVAPSASQHHDDRDDLRRPSLGERSRSRPERRTATASHSSRSPCSPSSARRSRHDARAAPGDRRHRRAAREALAEAA